MKALIESLVTQSMTWSLTIVIIISFLESLALIGLILPGAIVMASLGAMIGSGKISLYPAWIAGTTGCLLGDWLSFYLGKKFKNSLHQWNFLKKYNLILDKIKYALYKYSMFTILIGKFIGHTRPLILLIAGMMDLSVKKILIPTLISCLLWPPLYFIPGILTGAIIDIPTNKYSIFFKILLFITIIFFWIGIWLCWRWKSYYKKDDWITQSISINNIRWIASFFLIFGLVGFIGVQFHPMMILFRRSLFNVFIIY